MMKIGIGYDVHRLVKDRELILGGVCIPFEKGLLGHSDADVLIHALCDAMLGAAGLGDIGKHFPDQDPRYKDIHSLKLLEKISAIIKRRDLQVVNVDAVVLAESPKLAPYRQEMQRNISETLKVSSACINIKATTTEGLGFIGNKEGIGAMCVVLLQSE